MGGVYGGGGAITEATDMRFQTTRADDLAGFVGGGSNERQPDRDARLVGGLRGDCADGLCGRY